MAEEIRGICGHAVHLNGSPLTAMDLATEAAKQCGLDLKVDPVLQRSAARWEAVEAEVTLGQVMDAIAKGTGGECQIRSAIWPDWEGDKEGYTLWLFAPSKAGR